MQVIRWFTLLTKKNSSIFDLSGGQGGEPLPYYLFFLNIPRIFKSGLKRLFPFLEGSGPGEYRKGPITKDKREKRLGKKIKECSVASTEYKKIKVGCTKKYY